MRFWQAFVTAQMAGGAVWADRYTANFWWHLGADMLNIVVGAGMWLVLKPAKE